MMFYEFIVTLTFESKWTFVPNLKTFPQDVSESWHSLEWDRREETVTFDHRNLIRYFLSPNGHLCQSKRKSHQGVSEILCL